MYNFEVKQNNNSNIANGIDSPKSDRSRSPSPTHEVPLFIDTARNITNSNHLMEPPTILVNEVLINHGNEEKSILKETYNYNNFTYNNVNLQDSKPKVYLQFATEHKKNLSF